MEHTGGAPVPPCECGAGAGGTLSGLVYSICLAHNLAIQGMSRHEIEGICNWRLKNLTESVYL